MIQAHISRPVAGGWLWLAVAIFTSQPAALAEEASIPWQELTCEASQRDECERLGSVLDSKKRTVDAMLLYTRACREGSGKSCAKVAWHFHREGNRSDAYTTFQRACALDHGASCFYLGTLSREAADQKIAYQRACAHGISLACQRIGQSVPMAAERGMTKPSVSCTQNDMQACYQNGRAHFQKGEFAQAVADLYPVCQNNQHEQACHILGVAYLKTKQPVAAHEAFHLACRQGVAASCHALGEIEADRDQAAAEAFYREACNLGMGQSCYQMARDFNRSSIAEQTISFLKQGCQLGHSASCFSLRAAERETEGRSTAAGH